MTQGPERPCDALLADMEGHDGTSGLRWRFWRGATQSARLLLECWMEWEGPGRTGFHFRHEGHLPICLLFDYNASLDTLHIRVDRPNLISSYRHTDLQGQQIHHHSSHTVKVPTISVTVSTTPQSRPSWAFACEPPCRNSTSTKDQTPSSAIVAQSAQIPEHNMTATMTGNLPAASHLPLTRQAHG